MSARGYLIIAALAVNGLLWVGIVSLGNAVLA